MGNILIGNIIVLVIGFIMTFVITPILIYKAIKDYKDICK